MMFKELTLPKQQNACVVRRRWWVEQINNCGSNLSKSGGFISDWIDNVEEIFFDTEADANKKAYDYYTNNGVHYPYIV